MPKGPKLGPLVICSTKEKLGGLLGMEREKGGNGAISGIVIRYAHLEGEVSDLLLVGSFSFPLMCGHHLLLRDPKC